MEQTPPIAGRGRRAFTAIAGGAALVILVVVITVVGLHNVVARAVVVAAARGLGYNVTSRTLDIGVSEAVITGLHVTNLRGEPVADADRIAIAFSLRDLLPGSKRFLGLQSIAIVAPHIVVIHHPDATYNITLPANSAPPASTSAPPLDVRLNVRGGSVDLIDRYVAAPRERRERIVGITADGAISPATSSRYRAAAVLVDGAGRYPIRGSGRFDAARGLELQHVTAAQLPIAALANFALSTHAIGVRAGEVDDLDLRLGALATPAGRMQSHLGASGRLANGVIAATALARPVRDVAGRFIVDDDSVTLTGLAASVNGLPLHVRGALFHFADPHVRFALTAHGDLNRVRAISPDLARLPIGGPVSLEAIVEGSAANPLIFARVAAPLVTYGTYRLAAAHGFVALAGQELDVLAARATYGPIAVAGRGALHLARHTRTVAYALIHVPADALPDVDRIIPGLALDGSAVVRGTDARLAAHGSIGGSDARQSLNLPFSLAATGSGTLGPLLLERRDGASAYARATFDWPAKRGAALLAIRGLTLLPAPAAHLPGLALPAAPPRLDGKLDAVLVGTASASAPASGIGRLHASGSWGDIRADGAGSATALAARGRITSSFERLAAYTGAVGAHGGIDLPFAISHAGRSTFVQVAGARFPRAALRGIPLAGADATLSIGSRSVDVIAADVGVAGREITAQGRLGDGGHVHVTTSDLDLARLRSAGIPLANGRATIIADVGGTVRQPVATVRATLAGARYAGSAVSGDLGASYDGRALALERATATYAGAYASATGTVAGLVLGHLMPRYDVRAKLEDADIAALARAVKTPLRYPEGTLDADLRVGGAGADPSVAGVIRLPEGSLNGLNFRAGRVAVHGTAGGLSASGGEIAVGGTTLDFAGGLTRERQTLRLSSRRFDFADFDDYFDEADVLAGSGSLALAFAANPASLAASADLDLHGVRYRRFALGDVSATVRTVGDAVNLRADVAGDNGHAQLAGRIDVPASDPRRDLLHRSFVDLAGQIDGVKLGTVLPAAGISAPIFGTVDASATVRGRYPGLALSTRAALTNGVAGRLPIERFTLAASAVNGRGRLTDATVVAPGLNANLAGTFGLGPTDRLDLQAHVTSPNIATLATAATGKDPGVGGSLDTRASLTGTLTAPQVSSTIDVRTITYRTLTIPNLHAEISANRAAVDVRNGALGLPRGGSIAFDGHAPLRRDAATPIAFDLAPRGVDVAPYSPLLPDGSAVAGRFDGNVSVRGTWGTPLLAGQLRFANGSYRSNTLKQPLTAIGLTLNFAGTRIGIDQLHAHAAPGNFDGSGAIVLSDLRDPLPGLRANMTISASNALVSAPKYYVGFVDGKLDATKAANAALRVGGDLRFSSARIPYTALLPGGGSTQTTGPTLPTVDLDLGVTVGRDVRVQSGPVDIGTTGSARLGGTLAKPTLDGQFDATDGTVSVYRTFTVQNGSSVAFNPADGITPTVDATAVTQISDPSTDILLHITGLSTHLNLAFSSQPAYTQEQILGLLVNAQALGAVAGIASTNTGATNGPSVSGIGAGLLNEQFTQKFLQPFSSKVGGALGLSDLNLNYNTNGAVSAVARRTLGKNISFTYGEQLGGPTPRSSVGIDIGSAIAGAQLTLYEAAGSSQAFGGQALTPYLQSGFLATSAPNYTLQAIEPPTGSGFVFSYQRHFW